MVSKLIVLKALYMTREMGWCEWYQSIDVYFLYSSANFLKDFKGPRPFKEQKPFFSG
jgi:hypothetical protein